MKTERVKITAWITKDILFEAEVDASLSRGLKIGAAVRLALKAGVSLCGANLSEADLSEADLSEANLSRANLSEADLHEANLSGANLRGADLRGANLRGANLSRANLSGADLRGAIGIASLGTPDDWTAFAWVRDGQLSIRVGCRDKRLDEAREYWAGKDYRREVLAAVEYAAALAKARGWEV